VARSSEQVEVLRRQNPLSGPFRREVKINRVTARAESLRRVIFDSEVKSITVRGEVKIIAARDTTKKQLESDADHQSKVHRS
jgi:hypothetical protein